MINQNAANVKPQSEHYVNGHTPDLTEINTLVDASIVSRLPSPAESTSFIEQLKKFGDDTGADAIKAFAMENIDALIELSRVELTKIYDELNTRGVAAEWIRRELKPAINEEKQRVKNGVTWTDYVNAAHALGYTFALNELGDQIEVNGERMSDVIEAELLSRLHAESLRNVDVARRALITNAAQNRYHPVKRYLEKLRWNGADHIAALAEHFSDAHPLIEYENGDRKTVFLALFRRWLIGAVAKIYDPTNAQNAMLILDGAQGRGKSVFTKWLCPLPDLHIEGPIKTEDKDYSGYLSTRWIWEVSELGATIRKADREALKGFITQQNVTYRPAFGRHALHKPAMASFVGTVNLDGALLNDPTGHRRFWPVTITAIDWNYSRNIDLDQLWAQAYALYRTGESWKLSPEERVMHAEIVSRYEVEDLLESFVRKHFLIDTENDDLFTFTTEIVSTLRLHDALKTSDTTAAMRIASTLQKIGIIKQKRWQPESKQMRWGYAGITPIS